RGFGAAFAPQLSGWWRLDSRSAYLPFSFCTLTNSVLLTRISVLAGRWAASGRPLPRARGSVIHFMASPGPPRGSRRFTLFSLPAYSRFLAFIATLLRLFCWPSTVFFRR